MRNKLFGLFFSALLLAACSDGSPSAASTSNASPAGTQTVSSNGQTVQVYIETANEPFFIQRRNNQLGGFEYELLQAIAAKQGLQLQFTPVTWDAMFTAIENGQADIIASSISVTPERAQKMDFTNPHLESSNALLLGNELNNITQFSELNGTRIALQPNTTSHALAKQLWPKSEFKEEANMFALVQSAANGDTQAVFGDQYIMAYYKNSLANARSLRLLTDPNAPKDNLAFAVRKGNTELLNQLNDGLAAVKADGTYDRLVQQWFGSTNGETPIKPVAASSN